VTANPPVPRNACNTEGASFMPHRYFELNAFTKKQTKTKQKQQKKYPQKTKQNIKPHKN